MKASSLPGTFGAWVRLRRKQLDLTQLELGDRLGCSANTIRKIEAGERKPSRQLAELLANELQISATERDHFIQLGRGVYTEDTTSELGSVPQSPQTQTDNLTSPLTSLIDRTHDLAVVSSMLKDRSIRWITLIGPPGIGKTRLSLECGREVLPEFPDGVWFVDLAQVEDQAFVLPAIARALVGFDMPPSPGLDQLVFRLNGKHLLLILDNFEQVVDGALDVAQLLKRCAFVKVLATSRIALQIYGEHEYTIPSLSVPPAEAVNQPSRLVQYEAVQLLLARIRQHQPEFKIQADNASFVIDICTFLDGIPLALELAAASLRNMSLPELISMLHGVQDESWITQLSFPARDIPARQRTLEKVIDWSYCLLTEDQKAFFCQLGVFSGWFDEEAVAAVCMAGLAVPQTESRSLIDDLVKHSLLERSNFFGKAHWRMLEIIREYARLRLPTEQAYPLEHRRAEFYLQRINKIPPGLSESEEAKFFQMILPNLHAALAWAAAYQQPELAVQLTFRLNGFWHRFGYLREGLSMVQRVLAVSETFDSETRIRLMELASDLAWQQHDFDSGVKFAEQAVQLAGTAGMDQIAVFLNRLGRIYIEQGLYDQAGGVLNECLEYSRRNPLLLNPGIPLAQLGDVALAEGRWDAACSLLEESLSYLSADEYLFLAIAKTDLAEVALAQKDCARAFYWLEQSRGHVRLHVRRALAFISATVGFLLCSPQVNERPFELAAQFCGSIEALSERSGIILTPYLQKLNQERLLQVRRHLTVSIWQSVFEQGRVWSKEEVLKQVDQGLGFSDVD